ncbi:MAG: WYL domain-containing protein, partial [Chamaesiphon sp. CSU_1_12]|nr:WYL domain-containing protein [Chamaesiphon sp. CSU_1_12]
MNGSKPSYAIASKTPITIEYKSPNSKTETFIAEFAEIIWHERQYYLDIWTQTRLPTTDQGSTPDPDPDPDLPYNRCLRFDRIQSIESQPQIQWRSS